MTIIKIHIGATRKTSSVKYFGESSSETAGLITKAGG
jgi:hypothetical protein